MPAVKCVFLCELFVFLASVKGHGVRSDERPRLSGIHFCLSVFSGTFSEI